MSDGLCWRCTWARWFLLCHVYFQQSPSLIDWVRGFVKGILGLGESHCGMYTFSKAQDTHHHRFRSPWGMHIGLRTARISSISPTMEYYIFPTTKHRFFRSRRGYACKWKILYSNGQHNRESNVIDSTLARLALMDARRVLETDGFNGVLMTGSTTVHRDIAPDNARASKLRTITRPADSKTTFIPCIA